MCNEYSPWRWPSRVETCRRFLAVKIIYFVALVGVYLLRATLMFGGGFPNKIKLSVPSDVFVVSRRTWAHINSDACRKTDGPSITIIFPEHIFYCPKRATCPGCCNAVVRQRIKEVKKRHVFLEAHFLVTESDCYFFNTRHPRWYADTKVNFILFNRAVHFLVVSVRLKSIY
jgi:hypothetical protein